MSGRTRSYRWIPWALGVALFLSGPLFLMIQALREPDHVVPVAPPQNQRAIAPLRDAALSMPQASTVEVTLDEVNAYLAQTLVPPRASAGDWTLQRVAVRVQKGTCEVLTLQKWHGWNVFLNATYAVSLKGGKLNFKLLSGNLGKLSLGSFWAPFFEKPFLHLLPPLRKDRILMDRLLDLRMEPQKLVLSVRISSGTGDATVPK